MIDCVYIFCPSFACLYPTDLFTPSHLYKDKMQPYLDAIDERNALSVGVNIRYPDTFGTPTHWLKQFPSRTARSARSGGK